MNPGWSPHEQTERAGRVLWIALQNSIGKVRVTNILLSMRGNIRYGSNYRSVWMSDPDRIVGFLEDKPDTLTQPDLTWILTELDDL